MRVQLITRSPNRAPLKKTVVADWLRIGRNASCEIHLPDPRVPLEQGMIVNREGLVYLEGEAGSQNITRKSVKAVRLKAGEPLDIGPYRLTLQPAPQGFDAALQVELVRPLEAGEDFVSRNDRLTLASLGLTKRWAAWAWGITVVAVFLLLPAGRVLDLPWRDAAQKMGIGDRFWNPGPLMLAHQPISQKCGACHEVAFRHVRDTACLECHSRIGQHTRPELHAAGLFADERCTSCHRDHKGVKPTHRDDDRFCVDCHRDVRRQAPGADLANASDFARDHPPFKLAIPDGTGMRFVRMDQGPVKQPQGLKFPHATHLDPKGVRSPEEGRVKLECASCHHPDASKRSFVPVAMARDCQSCHKLQFEPAVTAREVPHGKPADALQVVDEFYANLALKGTPDSFQKAFGVPGQGLLRRAGAGDEGRADALRMASRKSQQVGTELFEKRVCAQCHQVSHDAGGWTIAAVAPAHAWMPRARFDHAAHAQSKCADCHDVAQSKSSADVAMPSIDACRECHGGSRPAVGKVTSNCLLCHGFHDERHPWKPDFKPKGASARVASVEPHAP